MAAGLVLPAVVVIGGAQAGVFAVRQLLRARAAGRLEAERIVVVDRDPACAAAGLFPATPGVTVEVADWGEWLDHRLDALPPEAHLVPYHWAPHLFFDWLLRQARSAGLSARRGPSPLAPRGVPYERPTRDGDRALSYATWTCPPTCIEPALCPHTRQAKDWSLCADLDGPALEASLGVGAAKPTSPPLVFRCLHLVYGVGTVPVGALFDARKTLLRRARLGGSTHLVATSSHCHALAATLEVQAASPVRPPAEG